MGGGGVVLSCLVAYVKHVVNDFYSLTIICEEIRFCEEKKEIWPIMGLYSNIINQC